MKKVSGRVIYSKLGDANNTALKKARDSMTEPIEIANKGKNPNDEKRKLRQDITIQEFFDEFYFPSHSELRKTTESQKVDKAVMRLYIPADIKRRRMLDINRGDMERMHNKLCIDICSTNCANRGLKLMRQMYNKAIDWGLPTINPAMRIKLFPEVKRDRFLQEDELPRLFRALVNEPNVMFRNFILLSLFAGQRRNNMQAIKWSDINFDRRVLYIPKTKTGEPQAVPLPRQALDILREMEVFKTSEWVFPSRTSKSGHLANPQKMWRELLRRATIENLRMHDLRRTFASYQAITGSSHEIIGKALGDKSPAVIPIYARLTEEPVRHSIQNAADKIFALAAPTEDEKD
jgi:integrase